MPRRVATGLLTTVLAGLFAACQPSGETPPRGPVAEAGVLLVYRNATYHDIRTTLKCSGTVVGDYVVTAQHCVRGGRPLVAFVEPLDICGPLPIPLQLGGALPATAASIEADIALLPIASPVPSLVPPPRPVGTEFSLVGWGWTPGQPLGCTSRTLALDQAEGCDEAGPYLCLAADGDNTCSGDSGSGVINARGERVAVTSGGSDCAPGSPSRYGRLDSVQGWLRDAGVEWR